MMKLNARIGAVTIRISGKHGGIYMLKVNLIIWNLNGGCDILYNEYI